MSYDDVYDQVIAEYKRTGSVKRTAQNVGTTLVRAQRILITEGLWSSETSRNVGRLYAEGKSVEQIAAELYVSIKTVQAYLPYTRTQQGYGGDDRSTDAVRAEKYRDRMHQAAVRQVDKDVFLEESAANVCSEQRGEMQEAADLIGEGPDMGQADLLMREASDIDQDRHLTKETSGMEQATACIRDISGIEQVQDASKASDDKKDADTNAAQDSVAETAGAGQASNVVRYEFRNAYDAYRFRFPCVLRLSLELDLSGIHVEEARILQKYGRVSKGITREVLVPADMTLHALHYVIMRAFGWENSHLHHFRLPGEIFNRMTGSDDGPDQYGFVARTGSLPRWADLCGIYFRFPSEDYDDIYWDDDYEEGVSFRTWLRRKYTGPYMYGGYGEHYQNAHYEAEQYISSKSQNEIHKETIADVELGFMTPMDELLERLKICDVLIPQEIDSPQDLDRRIRKLVRCYKEEENPQKCGVLPVTHELVYEYDYGDGWRVRIRLEDYYYTGCCKEETAGPEHDVYAARKAGCREVVYNMHDERESALLSEQIMAVNERRRPVCISIDGLALMDDVGGVYGYADFLRTIHEGDPDEAAEYHEWARSMGWTGRMNRPETLL